MAGHCTHFEYANFPDGGRCKIQAFGSEFVTYTLCRGCKLRNGRHPCSKISLFIYDDVVSKSANARFKCDSCKNKEYYLAMSGIKFESHVKCKVCTCPMKLVALVGPCPIKEF